jgi:Zn-dependent peptidase ImmA (M78 family)
LRTIPASFELGGHEISVTRSDTLIEDAEAYGICIPTQQKIIIQNPNNAVNKQFLLQTFWHEFVHMAMHQMGEHELCSNERFVDGLGHMLHQFHKTKRFK